MLVAAEVWGDFVECRCSSGLAGARVYYLLVARVYLLVARGCLVIGVALVRQGRAGVVHSQLVRGGGRWHGASTHVCSPWLRVGKL